MPTVEAGPSFHIETLGCRVNQYDEEMLRREFLRRGFSEVAFEEAADVYVINTCTVTQVADKKSRQLIRRALRANPQGRVIATGCAVGNKHALSRIPERVIQVSNREKERLLDVVRAELPPHHAVDEAPGSAAQARARALLKVQDGCNQFCTFCIVPFVRGRARSKAPEAVLAEARELVAAGYREIVVTGVHVGSYGRDLGDEEWSLGRLLLVLAERSGAARVRLSSIEPADFPREILPRLSDGICRHLHLALQHASDRVLERMRRGYTIAQYDAIVEEYLARYPEGALTADILVGFPGEDEADFSVLCEYLERRPFAHLHVFPYSTRPGTAAARYPEQPPAHVLNARMDAVLAIAKRKSRAFRERFVGSTVEVLVEECNGSVARGTTDNYLTVEIAGAATVGALVQVHLAAVSEDGLIGSPRKNV
ncbi:MAG: tRNA (N(6)-L-threonylcarbamoyladenosine(37)-C(2))-methylthiotransferase MtaB [Armatimonadetes bacterium]|nr:tRNA (N(6)-L-threonylcarbamoyladenosine(37)-C(2))-methylthiotransferase MtaB [Armatimonadota bacterium]